MRLSHWLGVRDPDIDPVSAFTTDGDSGTEYQLSGLLISSSLNWDPNPHLLKELGEGRWNDTCGHTWDVVKFYANVKYILHF